MTARKTTSFTGDEGFTLVEVIVAMAILLVGLLGFLQGVNVSMEHNLRNLLRNEASSIAERRLSEIRRASYSSLADTTYATSTEYVYGKVRGNASPYKIRREIVTVTNATTGTSSKQIRVLVSWTYKNVSSNYYEASTIRAE